MAALMALVLATIGWLGSAPVTDVPAALAAVVLAGLAALLAVPLSASGSFFSVAFAFVLAAGLRPQLGFRVALLALACELLPSLVRRHRPAVREGLAQLAAAVSAERLLHTGHPHAWAAAAFTAGLLYLAVRARSQDALLPQVLGVIFAALLLAQLPLPQAALLVPVLIGLQLSAMAAVVAGEEREKLAIVLDLERSRQKADRLEDSTRDMAALLEAFPALAGTLDRAELVRRFGFHLGKMVRLRQHLVVLEGQVVSGAAQPPAELLRATRPRLLEGFMAAPIPDWGLVVAEGEDYGQRQLDLLAALALEAAVALSNCRLHAEVRQAQSQLVQSSKLAAVGQLAAGVAHELNTPLGAISLALEYAQTQLTELPAVSQKLDLALRSGEKMQGIIDKLLHYSRQNDGPGSVFLLRPVVQDTLEMCAHHLDRRKLRVQLEVPDNLSVFGKPGELQQVFTNLVLNAGDAGAGRVLVRAVAQSDGVVCEVLDDGPGVPESVRTQIFDPFFTTKPQGQGTGLGLSISREIVEKHGGRLELVEGNCFRLTLRTHG